MESLTLSLIVLPPKDTYVFVPDSKRAVLLQLQSGAKP